MRLTEGNSKCCHLKKLTCKGTLRQVFICLRPRTRYPPRLHTIYVYTVHLFTQERAGWGGELNQREGSRGNKVTMVGRIYQHTDCISAL